tara:strand:+ start:304 stop:975 length:672 start_codon:yes stop_codon:yes gene_type:complete
MKGILYWISDFRSRLEHNRNAKGLISDLKKRYYRPKSSDLIKILNELENKAGLSSYDIVPYLIKIRLMAAKGTMIEEGSGGAVSDRKRNSELFKELEDLGFIRIIENNLYSNFNGSTFPTPVGDCILKVKLLTKGIDYLIEHRKKKRDYRYTILTITLLSITVIFSIPQACNNWRQYQILKDSTKDGGIKESNLNIKMNDTPPLGRKDKLQTGLKLKIEPISK